MRIAIDGRYISDHFPGIGRYIYNLVLALAELDTPHTFALLYNPGLPNSRHDIAALARYTPIRLIATRARPFSAAEQTVIPRLLRAMEAALYHAPYYVRPYLPLPCPSATTLYDAIPRLFPAEVSRRARLLFDLLTRLAARSSAHILAISESASADLAAAYRIAPNRMTVTPLAADSRYRPQPVSAIASVRAKYGLPERYVLSLSSNKPHKNLVSLVEAWARVLETSRQADKQTSRQGFLEQSAGLPVSRSPGLVIAGHWDPRYPEARAATDQLGLGERVRWLPGVSEADLPALYSGAVLFVFPSRYEGFGLPPLEAMACGVPVLCGDTSSLPEVVGDAALRVEPTAEGLAAGLARLLGDVALREELAEAGHRRAAGFTWKKTAQATLAVYEQIGLRRA
jgi:glycosyltransferase involved in cell wall biosynthesis